MACSIMPGLFERKSVRGVEAQHRGRGDGQGQVGWVDLGAGARLRPRYSQIRLQSRLLPMAIGIAWRSPAWLPATLASSATSSASGTWAAAVSSTRRPSGVRSPWMRTRTQTACLPRCLHVYTVPELALVGFICCIFFSELDT